VPILHFNFDTDQARGAIVIPVLESTSHSSDVAPQLLLIEEFRPALGEKIIGFPRGFPASEVKANEQHATKLALKELNEETGILSGSDVKFSVPKKSGPFMQIAEITMSLIQL